MDRCTHNYKCVTSLLTITNASQKGDHFVPAFSGSRRVEQYCAHAERIGDGNVVGFIIDDKRAFCRSARGQKAPLEGASIGLIDAVVGTTDDQVDQVENLKLARPRAQDLVAENHRSGVLLAGKTNDVDGCRSVDAVVWVLQDLVMRPGTDPVEVENEEIETWHQYT